MTRRHRISRSIVAFALVAGSTAVAAPTAYAAPGDVQGVVFRDVNSNGIRDAGEPGQGGVEVRAFDSDATAVGPAITAADGTYSLPTAGLNAAVPEFRVEFTITQAHLTAGPRPAPAAPGAVRNGGDVQFVAAPGAGMATANFAVLDASEYCQANPEVAIACFAGGPLTSGLDTIVTFGYVPAPDGYDLDGQGQDDSASITTVETNTESGSIWGLAYHRRGQRYLSSQFAKRYVPYLGSDPDPILVTNPATGVTSTLIGSIDAGSDTHTGGPTFATDTMWGDVGKAAWGGLALSADERSLWAVNLASRRLHRIDPGAQPGPGTGTAMGSFAFPDPGTGPTGCPLPPSPPAGLNPNLRPGGVTVHDGDVYVTLTCTAEAVAGQTNSNVVTAPRTPNADAVARRAFLRGFVYRFDGATFTQVANFPLDYAKTCISNGGGICADADYLPWTPDQRTMDGPFGQVFYPQPWLTDIAFDAVNNAAIVAITDRFGHQSGNDNGQGTGQQEGAAGGDILRFATGGATWTLESNAAVPGFPATGGAGNGQGPGPTAGPTGEFFFEDNYQNTHHEVGTGSVVAAYGADEIIATVFDPESDFRAGGARWFDTTDGTRTGNIVLYTRDQIGTFGKANGFGDLSLVCEAAPVQIGDRVWYDIDQDGIQDPGEPGIDGATVTLLDSLGNPTGLSSSTAGGGLWSFPIAHDTTYTVRIDMTTATLPFALADLRLSPAGADADQRDSDAVATGTPDVFDIAVPAHAPGDNDLTFDAGFYEYVPVAIGNQVWHDRNDNGLIDGGEPFLQSVALTLLDGLGNPTGFTTITDASGRYIFENLDPGDYIVQVDAANFGPGNPLESFVSSTPTSTTDDQVDGDDNGTPVGADIRSPVISLAPGAEPLAESPTNGSTPDADGDLTIDFGFHRPHALGNEVWFDDNNNGVRDPAEAAAAGVTLTLLDGLGNPTGATAVTGPDGLYLFDGLIAGDYIVEIDASNFAPGGALEGTRSSTPTATADNGIDGDDNGTPVGGPGSAVRSPVTTLDDGTEPTGEAPANTPPPAAADDDTDLTVDFGFYLTRQLGDTVWYDGLAPGDGTQPGPGVSGVRVELRRASDGSLVTFQITDPGGNYLFVDLDPAIYYVVFVLPGGTRFAPQNASGDDTTDSDANLAGRTPNIDLVTATSDLTVDAGLVVEAAVEVEKQVEDPDAPGTWFNADLLDGETPLDDRWVAILLNGTANYRYVVTNPAGSSASLTDIRLTEQTLAGPTCPSGGPVDLTAVGGVLDPGESVTVDPSPDCELTPVAADFINTADVVATPSDSAGVPLNAALGLPPGTIADVTDVDTAEVRPVTPSITIDKTPNIQTIAPATATVNFTMTVTNTSANVPELENVVVNDTVSGGIGTCTTGPTFTGGDTDADNRLDVGETWTYTCSVDDPGPWPDSFTNTADVTADVPATDPDGYPLPASPPVTDSDVVNVFVADLGITKEVRERGADVGAGAPGPFTSSETIRSGEDVDWRVVVTNNGGSVLENVSLTDTACPMNGPSTSLAAFLFPDAATGINGDTSGDGLLTLSPGESWTLLCQTDALTVDTTNVVDVTAEPAGTGSPITSSASADVTVVNPHVSVQIEVFDPLAGVFIDADADVGTEGSNGGGAAVLTRGTTAEYRVTVCNPDSGGLGDGLTLTGVSVDVTLPDGGSTTINVASLSDGACQVFTSADDPALAVSNVATASDAVAQGAASGSEAGGEQFGPVDGPFSGAGPDGDEDANDRDVATIQLADVTVKKYVSDDPAGPFVDAQDGSPFTILEDNDVSYEVHVTNDGDVALGNVTPTDGLAGCTLAGPVTDVGDLGVIDPGETWVYTCTVVGGFPASGGSVRNVADATADPVDPGAPTVPIGQPVTDSDEANVDVTPAAAIGDFVWLDLDADGVQDPGELGIENVVVNLLDAGGNPTGLSRTTDVDGLFLFTGLAPGDYSLEFVIPGGFFVSPQDAPAAADDTEDSDANPITGRTVTTTLSAGETDRTWDLGLFQPATLGNFVWTDTNADGVQDPGELGLENVQVTLTDDLGNPVTDVNGNPVAPALTDGSGLYLFTDLVPGDYLVAFAPPPGSFISPQDAPAAADDTEDSDADPATGQTAVINLESGEDDRTWDVGVYETASLGDLVWLDLDADGVQDLPGEVGIENVEVRLTDDLGNPVTDVNGNPVVPVFTDVNGAYGFVDLVPGDHVVTFVAPGGLEFSPQDAAAAPDDLSDSDANVLTGATTIITLDSGENDPSWDAGLFARASLGDRVWLDLDGDGVQDPSETAGVGNVTVRLLDASGGLVTQTLTDGSGNYLFDNLVPGTYSVEFVLPGGFVFSPQDAPSAPDDLSDSDADASGATVQTTLVSGENDLSWDAGLFAPASLGDFVWFDGLVGSNDGVQDAGEVASFGVDGVDVTIFDVATGAPVVTDVFGNPYTATQTTVDGAYLFTDLAPGDYYVVFTLPAGAVFTTEDVGADDADSDPDVLGSTVDTPATLTSGLGDFTWDAGVVVQAEVLVEKQVQDPDDPLVWLNADALDGETPPDDRWVAVLDGGTATYRWVVTNPATAGNVGLTDVVLDDPALVGAGCPANLVVDLTAVGGVLDPGESVTVEPGCTGTVTADFVNTSDVSASPSTAGGATFASVFGVAVPDVTDDDPAEVRPVVPLITVDKLPDVQTIRPDDDPVSFTIEVTNTSTNVAELVNVNVTDTTSMGAGVDCTPVLVSGDTDSDNALDVGETWVYSCDVARPAGGWDLSWTNTADVTADVPDTDPDGYPLPTSPPVTGSDTADVTVSDLVVAKLVRERQSDVTDPASPPGPFVASETIRSGEDVDFEVTVTNSGAVTLSNVTLADPGCPDLNGPSTGLAALLVSNTGDTAADGLTTLSPGETWVFVCQLDGVTADLTNIVDVTGEPPAGPPATGTASADVSVVAPHVSVQIEVFDPFTATWIDADADAGTEGTNGGGAAVVAAGDTAEFRVTVCNPDSGLAGDGLTLTGVSVDVTLPGGAATTLNLPTLAPDTCVTLTSADDPALDVTAATTPGVATAQVAATGSEAAGEPFGPVDGPFSGAGPDGDADTNDQDTATLQIAAIDLRKFVLDGGLVDAQDGEDPVGVIEGEPVEFQIVVTNVGSVDLGSVAVSDGLPGCSLSGPIESTAGAVLSPGETWTFSCQFVEGFSDVAAVRNVASVTAVPVDGSGTPIGAPVTDADEANVDVTLLGSIGDRVWLDEDGDGVQDPGEPGVPGVTVILRDGTGSIIATTTTDADGNYLFEGLLPGDYIVEVVLPDGFEFTDRDRGGDDAADSDVDTIAGTTPVTALAEGAEDLTLDAGLVLVLVIDLAVDKVLEADLVAGSLATWRLTVTNVGDARDPGPITVTDDVPAGLEAVTAVGVGWTCDAAPSLVTCTYADGLDPAESAPPIVLMTLVTAAAGDAVVNAAAVRSTLQTNPTNDEGVALGTVLSQAPTLPTTGGGPWRLTVLAILALLAGAGALQLGRRAPPTGRPGAMP